VSTHPLVIQLRFARSEFMRCLEGVTEEEAVKRPLPMNCLSWVVGHMANQENRFWVIRAQGKNAAPGLHERVGYGQPASTPSLSEMWGMWRAVTASADMYLDTLTPEILQTHFIVDGNPFPESVGTMLMRNLYHYWFHTGEAHAIRQILGHKDLPDFVGDMEKASYAPES
jgi:DinB superfamily